jgi:maltose O-acetyltransferase
MARLLRVLREEFVPVGIRYIIADFLLKLFPSFVGSRIRVKLLQFAGFRIGKKCIIMGTPRFTVAKNMMENFHLGNSVLMNIDCFFDLAGPIRIEDRVGIGQQAMLITGAHQIGDEHQRAGYLDPQPIVIEEGAWLGARCIILPGVTVGRGAVVAAGAIVTKDVPPNTLVAGIPAKVIKSLPTSRELKPPSNGYKPELAQKFW